MEIRTWGWKCRSSSNRSDLAQHLRGMYDSRAMIVVFPKGRLAMAVPLVVLILSLVTACSLLNSPPVADFFVFPDSGSAPLVVSFDASSSSDTGGIIVAYQWEFGDETTGSGKTKTHTYELPGEYIARLTVTDDDGAKDSTIQTIQVDQAAITASFVANPTSGESPLSVDFDASDSFDPDGQSITYTWSFGDGSTGAGVVARHTYYTAGIYAVLLTVRNESGDEDQATATIAVSAAPIPGNAKPNAEFTSTPNAGEVPLTVSFDASGSSDSDGHITSYQWTFGDGESGSGATTSHTYTDSGTYEVWLMVADNNGATDTATATIQATASNVSPVASFSASPTSGDAPLEVSFDASASYDPDGFIVSHSWSFGDGETGSGAGATHAYSNAGTYTAQLTVTDDDGSTGSATRTIEVAAAPVANIPPTASFTASPTSGDAPLAVSFNGSGSSDSDGSIASYAWSFGDGGSSSGVTAIHTYSSAGTYTVQLTVTDDDGSTGSATRTIEVAAAPVANIPPTASFTASPTSGDAPLAVSFNGSGSSDSDGSIASYAWSFGDGGSSSGVTAIHTYSSAGTYTVRLTVTDDDGSTDSATRTIQVTAAPVPEDLYVDANSGSDTTGDGTDGNPYKTITKAVSVASTDGNAHTLHVAAGLYNNALGEESPLELDQGISVVGEGTTRDDVKIVVQVNCLSNSSLQKVQCFRGIVLDNKLAGTALSNVHVDGPDKGNGVWVRNLTGQIAIVDCLIENCGSGVAVWASTGTLTVQNCEIKSCDYQGIISVYAVSLVIEQCVISNCSAGIDISSGTMTINNNTISDCYQGIGVISASGTINNNAIDDCSRGIGVRGEACQVSVTDTAITNSDHYGVYVYPSVSDGAVDLGGGTANSTGGNTISGSGRYNIYDERLSYSGSIYAKNNTWDDPQPMGTVEGPLDIPPNYIITNEGNIIIFSD